MEIDLEKGMSFKIEGELGKYQTLSIESLIKIAQSLQELVLAIAKYDLPANEAIDLNNFKLELIDFQKGSAIPSFALTQRVLPTAGDYQKQRVEVTKRLNNLLEISDKGTYPELIELYPEYITRNEIVKKLYGFTTSFNNSPVSIYERGKNYDSTKSYKPKKFKFSVKKNLIVSVKQILEEKQTKKAFARVNVITKGGKTQNRIQEIISTSQHSLSYSPEVINVNNRQYILNYPLRCLFEKEENYYLINNEQLDIIGTGITQNEAEFNFNEEFDYLYTRLNSLRDNQINTRLLRIKKVLNSFVKQVQ